MANDGVVAEYQGGEPPGRPGPVVDFNDPAWNGGSDEHWLRQVARRKARARVQQWLDARRGARAERLRRLAAERRGRVGGGGA